MGLIVAGFFLLLGEGIGHLVFRVTQGRALWNAAGESSSSLFCPYTLHEYRPNSVARLPRYPEDLKTDRYGFIHNGSDRAITREEYVIFLLGGSTVEGRGASGNEQTIAAQLEQLINSAGGQAGKKVRVINAGRRGFFSYQEFCLLYGKLLPNFPIDMVIALDGRNDAYYAGAFGGSRWKPNWSPEYDAVAALVNDAQERCGYVGAAEVVDWLGRYSITVHLLHKAAPQKANRELEERFESKGRVSDEILQKACAYYVNTHILMRQLGVMNGFEYEAFLQPVLLPEKKAKFSANEEKMLERFLSKGGSDREVYFDAIGRYYSATEKRIAGNEWFHDLSGIFANVSDNAYTDSCHYCDEGNRQIALAIQKTLNARGKTKTAAPIPAEQAASQK